MKKTLAAAATAIALASAPAFAADLPMKAAPMPVAVWSWTGFYIGAHVGAGWGETESTITGFSAAFPAIVAPGGAIAGTANLPFNQNSRSGFLGGGQAGANWQSGLFVLGVQGDIAGLDVKGTDPCLVFLTCTSKSDWLATVSGRVGAVIMDRGMIYAKGGGAWLHTNNTVALGSLAIAGVPIIPATNITSGSYDQGGWLVGLGTEWMITQNWTAFIEYDYMRFENKRVNFNINPALVAPATVTINTNQTNTLSIAKVGVNYKFGWGNSVVAKY
jgi:outer membrane immunogenic protein